MSLSCRKDRMMICGIVLRQHRNVTDDRRHAHGTISKTPVSAGDIRHYSRCVTQNVDACLGKVDRVRRDIVAQFRG